MWKNKNVVMLPTNEKVHNTFMVDNLEIHTDHKISLNGIEQQLYITSDKEVKEGSLVLLPDNTIHRMNASDIIGYLDSQSKSTKSVVATTQLYLNLPQPSQRFIEEFIDGYNKGNIIADVEIEYEEKPAWGNPVNYQLRVNPKDNTINIKPIKDSWNREEIIRLCKNAFDDSCKYSNFDEWIEENL